MSSELDELLADFLEECKDILSRLHGILASFDGKDESARQDFEELLRGLHTIKGGAGMFDMQHVTQFVHKLESALQKYKDDPSAFGPNAVKSVVGHLDKAETLLGIDSVSPLETIEVEEIESNSDIVVQEEINPDTKPAENNTFSQEACFDVIKEESTNAQPGVSNQAPNVESIGSVNSRENEERNRNSTAKQPQEVIRVPAHRLDRNMDVISEIFLLRNQMSFLVENEFAKSTEHYDFLMKWEALDNSLRKGISELENTAMTMRMMPIKTLFQRMEKTVRAYSKEAQKDIRVELSGENTEVDKKVLDCLAEPIVHLVRNAMDHGIEPSDERIEAKKPTMGTINLHAELRGNEVVLNISDDGKGIDAQKVVESARKKGIDVSNVKNPKQALDLIFLPGFSTAEKISDVSGRGVGMDAVCNYVEKIGGTITLNTIVGKGSTFSLSLPLGMSVIPAIVVEVNSRKFAVSTDDILEAKRFDKNLILKNGDETFLDYKGKTIPCFFLEEFIATDNAIEHKLVRAKEPICIVKTQIGEVAFGVGNFVSNTEIATKPLPQIAPKMSYVTGASILETGEPTFVLSMSRLHEYISFNEDFNHDSERRKIA